jgi:hypothetical protein
MARTEAGLGLQAGESATLAIGEEILAAGGVVFRRNNLRQNNGDFGGGAVIRGGGVHEFSFLGYTPGAFCIVNKRKELQNLMVVSC